VAERLGTGEIVGEISHHKKHTAEWGTESPIHVAAASAARTEANRAALDAQASRSCNEGAQAVPTRTITSATRIRPVPILGWRRTGWKVTKS